MVSCVATIHLTTNQSCATRKGASGYAGAARAALVAQGRREPCRGRAGRAGPSERTTARGGRELGRTRTRASAPEPGHGGGRVPRAWDGDRVGRGGGSRAAAPSRGAAPRPGTRAEPCAGDGAGERAAPGWGRGRTAPRERGPGPAGQRHGRGGGKGGDRREEGGEAYRVGVRAIGVEGERERHARGRGEREGGLGEGWG
jgi:hypothetical protein